MTSEQAATRQAEHECMQQELIDALHALEVAANTVAYCYELQAGNFAAALQGMADEAERARSILARVRGDA